MLALAALLLVACGGDETPTAQPTAVTEEATVAPTTVPTEEVPIVIPTTESSVVDPSLINVTWEWVQRTSNLGEEILIAVPNPENYTLLFDAEGAFTTQLDCNNAAGTYTSSSPGGIFMELGPMTQAACSPDSLAGEMVNMFGPAQNYVLFLPPGRFDASSTRCGRG
jgi:heat shock protein HslJ